MIHSLYKLRIGFIVAIGLSALVACQSLSKKAYLESDPTHTYEVIHFNSLDGTLLRGHLYKPKGEGPFPAIVALHGCSGLFLKNHKINPRDFDWGKRLAENGYVALYPDSFTTRKLDEICTKKNITGFAQDVRPGDAFGASTWLQSQSFVKKDKIGIMGWSNGGSSLLWTLNQKLKSQLNDSHADFKIAVAYYPGCRAIEQNSEWLNRLPVEIFIGELDDWTLAASCQALVQRGKKENPMNITVYPGAYHDFDHPDLSIQKVKNLAFTPTHEATIGTHKPSREDSIKKVLAILERTLKK